MELNQKEILRYLGYRGKPADEIIQQQIQVCMQELEEAMAPKAVFRTYNVTVTGDNQLKIGGMEIQSKQLSLHIQGCKQASVFAATLGAKVDFLIQRYNILDMSKAVILQACAATAIEEYCDQRQEEIQAEAAEQGLYLRPRYSPGYGDFPITHQKALLGLLDAHKRIGLTTTDSFMLVPSKSVTAIIGFTNEKKSCHIARCMTCEAKNCPFRKEE